MATLVLTTIGGLVGGPIGAAVGGILGQAVDRDVLFRPKGRQGPRLIELAVQTSSYGTPLPRLFGTLRIAGCVIWSTDLIESKSTSSSGKGQPKVTNYSYSASFAVALSARPILGIGRIWADGTMLRGAAGDFKSQVAGFRLHTGAEDQLADPLIASAEGAAVTPAYRGLAYAVFEGLELGDFGNRIPSLTFEVIADAAAVDAGTIARDVAGGIVADSAVALPLDGFSAYGDSIRGVLETLSDASGAWFAPAGTALAMRDAVATTATLGDDGVSADGGAARRIRSIAGIDTVAKTVTLTHYDPARDYQAGLQRAARPGAGDRDDRVELPAAVSAGAAKTIAESLLARAEAGRVRRELALGLSALAIIPGDGVAIAGESGTWRVVDAALEAMVVRLGLMPLHAVPAPASASSGRVLPAPDVAVGHTIVHAFETPSLDDSLLQAPRLTIAAAGSGAGWRRAALLYSLDGGAHWLDGGTTAAAAVMGTLVSTPAAAPATLFDLRDAFEIELANDAMALAGADDGAIDSGANLALVGDELIQFGHAEQLAPRRWRLSRLLRGRRGTEAAIGTGAVGVRFVLLDRDRAATIDLPMAAIGQTVRVTAYGIGDDAPVPDDAVVSGQSVTPPSPVSLGWENGADGGAVVRWIRRSRLGWRWIDGGDVPLGEESERYRVTVTTAAGAVRDTVVTTPEVEVTATERAGAVAVTVRQVGTNGESPGTTIEIPASGEA